MTKNVIIFIVIFVYTNILTAQTFEPPVIIDPPHPMVGDTIRVGVFEVFFPPCLTLPGQNQDGLTHLFESKGNTINFYVVNDFVPLIFCFPFPANPAPREWYELGKLEAGTYQLYTYIADISTPLPLPDNFPYTLELFGNGYREFEVRSAPQPIDTLTNVGLLIMIIMILTLSSIYYRTRL